MAIIITNGPSSNPNLYRVEFSEHVEGSPEESADERQGKNTRTIFVAWDDRDTAKAAFLGGPILLNNDPATGLGGYIERVVPLRYPTNELLFAQGEPKVEGVGYRGKTATGTSLAMARYELAKITFKFENVSYPILDDNQLPDGDIGGPSEGAGLAAGVRRFITKIIHPGGRIFNLNRGFMYVISDGPLGGRVLPEGLPIYMPFRSIEYHWHQVPLRAIPFKTQQVALRTVNDDVFDGSPKECLLLEGCDISPEYLAPNGVKCADVIYRIKEQFNAGSYIDPQTLAVVNEPRPNGHNFILWRWTGTKVAPTPARLLWVRTSSDGTLSGTPPYPSFSFQKLFQPDQP